MSLMTILLQNMAGQEQWTSILMMVAIFAIFYFFMIRPQQKKQKEIRKFRDALKVGDRVITAGGIYGKVKEINDVSIVVEIASGVSITVDKSSIYGAAEDNQQTK